MVFPMSTRFQKRCGSHYRNFFAFIRMDYIMCSNVPFLQQNSQHLFNYVIGAFFCNCKGKFVYTPARWTVTVGITLIAKTLQVPSGSAIYTL